jgi:hypothetical protein
MRVDTGERIPMRRKSRKKDTKAVSASALAQMGVCERLVVFEHRNGTRRTASQRAAIRRGLQAHEQFFRDGHRMSGKRRLCYIATLTFGEGPEVVALRVLRDWVLAENAGGRWLIRMYYRTAPTVCSVLVRFPRLQPIVRMFLRPIAWIAARVLRGRKRDHGG